ncbi:MAG: NusG domain II-containing protein [gamma proteobacterium symbiont of Bathyaustriella thionipta]|nr:NusG domain II-containing protein [gamma proteobacterium symbiont of Bathyaustriella thionipta]MCU7949895.1 NusG domain II-containing protein [gamma proteobacterium symbiont of Bathyaustriella thionipta]MCU7954071.1 NusG domain II-containing protein [gamma proteobacterium symbiont of Bathyaustriella thionipta]MCU7956492.1 NusG domain II-containing protein [gamma proteobacterium symbiont of Bathyaustriella thionipta]MCU7968566.1 NusG domain II-containing protein [gamma proteobacterium symbion
MLTIGKVIFKPADILILFAASILTLWLYSIFWFSANQQGEAEILRVQFADNPPLEYTLSEDRTIVLAGKIGDSLIEIKQGKARFIHSACRNQFCVFHGWLTVAGDSTACLPNRISISLKSALSDYDAIAGSQ